MKLPIELKLHFLKACLTRREPLIDFFRSGEWDHAKVRTWPMPYIYKGASVEIAGGIGEKPYVNILFTNRFFWEEGKKILLTTNHFTLTGLHTKFIRIPSALPEQRYFAQLKHLVFLHYNTPSAASMLGTVWHACKAARRLVNLETLAIDFGEAARVSLTAYEPGMTNARRFARAFSRSTNPNSKLQRISITGLYLCWFTLLLVGVTKNVLNPAGLIGVGFDEEGSRYEPHIRLCVNNRLILRPNTKMKLHWMARDEVHDWFVSTRTGLSAKTYLATFLIPDIDEFASESEVEADSGSGSKDEDLLDRFPDW